MSKVELPSSTLNLPSNSINSASTPPATEKEHKAKKVVTGKVITKKPSIGKKFKEVFIGDETADVKSYVLLDVIVPAIKDLISDVVTGGVDMVLFGDRRTRSRRSSGPGQYTSYSSYYNKPTQTKSRPSEARGGYAVREIIFETRGEAEDVLGNMIDTIKDYGMVSVGDLYDMIGEPGAFTDNAWGWVDLGSASVRRVREGYTLVLPKVISLK